MIEPRVAHAPRTVTMLKPRRIYSSRYGASHQIHESRDPAGGAEFLGVFAELAKYHLKFPYDWANITAQSIIARFPRLSARISFARLARDAGACNILCRYPQLENQTVFTKGENHEHEEARRSDDIRRTVGLRRFCSKRAVRLSRSRCSPRRQRFESQSQRQEEQG